MKRAFAALTVFLLGCDPVGSSLTPIFFSDDPNQPQPEAEQISWVQSDKQDTLISVQQPHSVDHNYTEEFYRWSAESGYPEGQQVYGLLLIYDKGELAAGMDFLHQALEQGCIPAALDLSWLFMKGIYVEQNLELAYEYLEPGFEAQNREAHRMAAQIALMQDRRDKAMSHLEEAANLGDLQSQRDLAQMIVEEKRGSWKQAQALIEDLQQDSLMEERAELEQYWPDNPYQKKAQIPVAPERSDHRENQFAADDHSLLPLPYTPLSYPTAFEKEFESAAAKGSPYAAYQAALNRLNTPTALRKMAVQYSLQQLVNQSTAIVPGQVLKARLILREYFPEHTIADAHKLLEKAAAQNDPYALFALSAWMREDGEYDLSLDYYQRAIVEPNYAMSLYRLVSDMIEGYYPFWQEELALDWLYMLAQQEYAPALLLLADLIEAGRVQGSTQEAFVHRYHAAWQGNPQAQYAVGNMYLRGDFVASNAKKAFRWFYQSAYRGYRPAQYQVSHHYEKGLGVVPNMPKAYAWRKISRLGLYENDQHELEALVRSMNQHQLQEALELEKVYMRNFPRPWTGRRSL